MKTCAHKTCGQSFTGYGVAVQAVMVAGAEDGGVTTRAAGKKMVFCSILCAGVELNTSPTPKYLAKVPEQPR